MHLFYISDLTKKTATLTAEESRHCLKVLRLRKGDKVQLLNGKGSIFQAVIQIPDPNGCQVEIVGEEHSEAVRPYHLSIAIAPTKSIDRFEWFLEKSTEIGIDRIVPLICRHSERRELKPERMERILVSAMKQSGQLLMPELVKPLTFDEFIIQPFTGDKFIAHCEPDTRVELKKLIRPRTNGLVLIGPEGDFDPEEIRDALINGFVPVSLGDSRLRTETAGLVACHTFCLMNQL
jgi:16S rRNA (uracil1498-N3)-methyltransferase